jgi:hypothetical protein
LWRTGRAAINNDLGRPHAAGAIGREKQCGLCDLVCFVQTANRDSSEQILFKRL